MRRSLDQADDTLAPAEARLAATRSAAPKDNKNVIIPTRLKAKISQNLSYPVGAKEVSDALISVPQFSELQLCFWTYQFHHEWRRGNYDFLRLGSASFGEAEWEVRVHPVPRLVRYGFHQYIVETALPQMAKRLVERAGKELGQGGVASVLLR